ncbi:hypothetical protein MPTK1_5g06720 [Marchantia polymorpha subsp. ruderalis]|uniref:YDG domain-containing protein n=2 Tax=Marchantia polymorpha TaxID=3197 RepID=A0AAF6BFN9_MARPO|nr:hypothetical protein MARPO_0171s0011 [Marchantia polymorpha]BBN10823.1 hypothetical protein Mp_5g06720 [Marchantia polymorpha subsp. ruderalis]|eukprot:PTQ28169.1 hypothetical protein MARPO_0171s0011 [Marchantia polymorpha]
MTRVGAAKNGKKLLLSRSHSKGKSLLQFASKSQDKPRDGMQSRRRGPSYNFQSENANVQKLLDQFDTFREKYRQKKKIESVALKDFCILFQPLLCNGVKSIDGDIPGVKNGQCFNSRVELYLVAAHHRLESGIDYLPAIRSPAMIDGEFVSIAVSVVLSGEKDDIDEGDTIHYCGEGGVGRRVDGVRSTEITEDQKLVGGNLALKNSAELGRSVRVIRKHKDSFHRSKFFYSYDGMYKVSRFYSERKKGALVYMFELNRVPNQGQLRW